MTHRLVLPLPPGYASNDVVGDVGEYSVFDVAAGGALPREAARYMDDLVRFLDTNRLIQYHPENYFAYKTASERAEGDPVPMHLDGRPISDTEILNLRHLCRAFESIVALSPDGCQMQNLASLVRDGPMGRLNASGLPVDIAADREAGAAPNPNPRSVAPDIATLDVFYQQTKSLMLHRKRRPSSDYATLMFQRDGTAASVPPQACDGGASDDALMRLMGEHAMCPKKYHEVGVMRSCIKDVLRHTPSVRGVEADRCEGDGHLVGATVINVGEGKGYCSRVLALCDGLQVVGLDCNPHHKEGASGRVERLVQGAVGAGRGPSASGTTASGASLNLMYRPRGHMASIACRVGPNMDWRSVLQGHVALTADDNVDDVLLDVTEPAALPAANMPLPTTKVQCRLCGQIYRGHCADIVVRHAREHVDAAKASVATAHGDGRALRCRRSGAVLSLQPAAFDALLASKPQQQCIADVLAAFYETTETAVPALPVEVRCAQTPSVPLHDTTTADPPGVPVLARGTRVVVWAGVQLEERKRVRPEDTDTDRKSSVRKCAINVRATILGYDEGTRRHKLQLDALREHDVLVDESQSRGGGSDGPPTPEIHSMTVVNLKNLNKQLMCTVVPPRAPPTARAPAAMLAEIEAAMASFSVPARWPTLTGVIPVVVLDAVLPTRSPIATPIAVPHLSNVALMGLHTCGDLGSNVCRLFLSSRAPALTLVSCCWHALTNDGFPLSRTMRDHGYSTESISLMLATQPLDMWCADAAPASDEASNRIVREDAGHRGSARLLFLRGLLPMVWADLTAAFAAACTPATCQRPAGGPCTVPPLPHLEPPFLRRMARVKDTVTLHAFAVAVLEEYCCDPRRCLTYGAATPAQERSAAAPVGSRRALCEHCAGWLHGLVRAAENGVLHAIASRLEEVHVRLHFRPFLGYTVLRMWMSHLVETVLLMDRALYVHEGLCGVERLSDVALVPLFDGALSPRMFGILARRGDGRR